MLLKPRKRIDPERLARSRPSPEPASCLFCKSRIEVPPKMPGPTDLRGGPCEGCGALCVADPTGKQGGEALMAALRAIAGGDEARALGLREGRDYESRAVAWNEVTHEIDPSRDATKYGVGRLWFFRKAGDEAR